MGRRLTSDHWQPPAPPQQTLWWRGAGTHLWWSRWGRPRILVSPCQPRGRDSSLGRPDWGQTGWSWSSLGWDTPRDHSRSRRPRRSQGSCLCFPTFPASWQLCKIPSTSPCPLQWVRCTCSERSEFCACSLTCLTSEVGSLCWRGRCSCSG